ncbi:hypothetical protein ACIGZI_34570 [Streptomyces griseus]|uniref:hypothetical protein n=1 Tax=Streptomyces griseus TaxID=1911 RepID=UPI0037CDF051
MKLPVPPGFDHARGWQDSLTWVPDGATSRPFAAAPRSGAVALLKKKGDAYVVEVRDEETGALRFAGEPWRAPQPLELYGEEASTPGVEIVVQDGVEHLVLWAHGREGEDGLSKGEEVVALAVYALDARGTSAAPARVVSVTYDGGRSAARVRDGGAGALITSERGDESVSVDARSGKVRRYPSTLELAGTCERVGCGGGSKVRAVTEKGPVVAHSSGGFGVPDVWNNSRFVPPGADAEGVEKDRARAVTAQPGHVVASWTAGDGGDGVWAVHAAESGEVEAEARCEEGPSDDSPSSLSPDGRYLTAGPLAFDLKEGKGFCFAETAQRRGVTLLSVGDDGVAYGLAKADPSVGGDASPAESPDAGAFTAGRAVTIPLSTGKAKALPEGVHPPVLSLGKAGVFTPPADGPGLLFAFYRRG